MRKLRIIEHISLDGVVQTFNSADSDFPYGDWTAQFRSPAGLQLVTEIYRGCDLLLGRRTYDLLASYWPKAPQTPMGDSLNAAAKYVVTRRPDSLAWTPAQPLGAAVEDEVRQLKAKAGPDLIVTGSLSLIAPLLEHGLADEVILLVNPIVLGKGKRLFADGSLPRSFALGSSRALPSGILVNIYKLIPTLAEEAVSRAKLDRELEIARQVQERLFPQSPPRIDGLDIAAHCRPADAVGGDYYDLIPFEAQALPDGQSHDSSAGKRLGIAVGDISGKGLSAALLMASLHASLRGQALSGAGDLASKMANINRLLYEASSSNRYATFFYAELECASHTLQYVNGGHNAPVVLRQEGSDWHTLRLAEGGAVVGMFAGTAYQQQQLRLRPGDILLAFTDGITEATNAQGEEWGEDRLLAEAQANTGMNATQLLQHLFRAVDAFVAGAPQHDDMTLVVLRVTG